MANDGDYTYMILDKAVEDIHDYTNKITKNITIEKMFLSNNKFVEDEIAIQHYNEFENVDKINEKIDKKLYKMYMFIYSENGAKIKITIVAINNKVLEKKIASKTQIPNEKFLITLCNSNILYNKALKGIDIYNACDKNDINNNINKIVDHVSQPNSEFTDPIEEQPDYCNFDLYDYQKRTIKWMLNTEINKNYIYYNPNDEIIIGNIVYDTIKQCFTHVESRQKFIFSGGALTEEVGLGKTCETIIMSLKNQAKNINYIQEHKNIFSRATLILCPSHLVNQWESEFKKVIKKNYEVNVVCIFTKLQHDKYAYQDLLDADFVIIPFAFLNNKNFLNTFLTKITKSASYLTGVKSQYKYEDLQNLLDNLSENIKNNPIELFNKYPNPLLIHWHRIIIDEFHEIYTISKYAHMLKLIKHFRGNFKWCVTGTPFNKTTLCMTSMFNFVTNYVNDADNDILLNKQINDYLMNNFFRRNTKKSIKDEHELPPLKETAVLMNFSPTEWAVYNAYLANPNTDKRGVLMRQLCCHPGIADEIKSKISNCKTLHDIEKVMISHYHSQMVNSLNKVKYVDYKINCAKQKIKILTWKRQKYYLNKMNYRVKIDIGNDVSDNEKMKEFEKYFANDDDFMNTNILESEELSEDSDDGKELVIISDITQNKIIKLLGKKINDNIPVNILNLKKICENFINKKKECEIEYNGKKATYDYYNDVVERIKKTTQYVDSDSDEDSDDEERENCAICLGNIKGTDIGVTKCGHMFCYNCVKPYIAKKPKCPVCQKAVNIDELYVIVRELENKKNENINNKDELIKIIGTKLANLIFFVKQVDSHCIIFSQWDDLLKKVGKVLNDYGIKNVFCKGNIWQCAKAINNFNNDENTRVIMLSSKCSASGMNLTKAEYVILLDPVMGSYEDCRNTEWQAIGRAHRIGQKKQVKVTRFVINNTVEHDIYIENLKEIKKHVTNAKISTLTENDIKLNDTKLKEINKVISLQKST